MLSVLRMYLLQITIMLLLLTLSVFKSIKITIGQQMHNRPKITLFQTLHNKNIVLQVLNLVSLIIA